MVFNRKKILSIFFWILMCSILIFPKINIIYVPGSRTGIRLDDICVLAYFIYFIYKYIFLHEKINLKIKKILGYFFLCFSVFFISTVFGIIKGNVSFVISILHLIRNIEYFVLIFAGYDYVKNCENKNNIYILLNTILIFHAVYMLLEYFNIIGDIGYLIGRPSSDRIYTTFSGPYEYSAFLTLLLPMYLLKIFKEKKWFNLFYVVVIIFGVLLSQSRISLLTCLFLIVVMYIFEYKSPKKKAITIIGLLSSIILLILTFNSDILFRFRSIDISSYVNTFQLAWKNTDYDYYKETGNINYSPKVLNSTTDESYALRVSKWATLLKETTKSPLFGLGLSIVGEATDGNYVRLIAESGVLGFLCWILLFLIILKESNRNKDNEISNLVFYSVISLSIIALFIDIFVASKIIMLFWFLVGAMYASIEKENKNKKKKIKIMHFLSGVNFGGVEAVIYNYFNNMKNNAKYENIIVSHEKINYDNRKMFEKLNFRFYEVTPKRISLIKNFFQINSIIKKEQPDIVHVHMTLSSYMALFIAYLNGVKVRICHSHLALNKISFKEKIEKYLCNYYANVYFACSVDASKYLFLKSNQKEAYILNNAIDLKKFDYNESVRNEIRKELNISKKFVIGNIGRFTEQKNHKKIISIFEKVLEKKKNSILLLIGDGNLKEEIRNLVISKGLDKNVIFLSGTSEIQKYYQCMDAFLFPSLFEGLGIVAVEAQVSGLPCIVSDVVPKDIEITDLVEFVNLDLSSQEWAKILIKKSSNIRSSSLKKMKNTNFDIKSQSNELDKIYLKLIEGE